MHSESLNLIPVQSILDARLKFYVPAYQRGYRWSAKQVEQLIDDLFEFMRLHPTDTAFYCLQPLVVKEIVIGNEKLLEVIDGQQRLTTILLILQAIHQKCPETFVAEEPADQRFEIRYETRPSSEKWLGELGKILYNADEYDAFDQKCCDYSHFAEVFKAAHDKLEDLDINVTEFYSCLCLRTYFIWYYPDDTDGTNADIFDRLNAGKISLNNAELIKALMLQRSNTVDSDASVIRTIAIEWDNIERRLNDREFWGFIYSSNHPYEYDTHIEYIFDLFTNKQRSHSDDYTYTFTCYLESYRTMMNDGGNHDIYRRKNWVETEWRKVKELYDTLNEWYADRHLYHRIGYILEYCADHTVCTLAQELKPLNRTDRIDFLDEIILQNVSTITSKQLFYKSDKLSRILFLYNILLEDRRYNQTARFSFADYKHIRKNLGWDQEHIASHIDYEVKEKDRIMLGKELIEFITGLPVEEQKDDAGKIVYSLPPVTDITPEETSG